MQSSGTTETDAVCPLTGISARHLPGHRTGPTVWTAREYLFKHSAQHEKGWMPHQLRRSAIQHLASLSRYVRRGEQASARVTAEADPATR